MKIKLETIYFSNNDIIATSCVNGWGVAEFKFETNHYVRYPGTQNGTNKSNKTKDMISRGNRDIRGALPLFDGDGYYHIDKNGNIIEKCPYSNQGDEAVYKEHNISIYN